MTGFSRNQRNIKSDNLFLVLYFDESFFEGKQKIDSVP